MANDPILFIVNIYILDYLNCRTSYNIIIFLATCTY
jgi:hypothetical protein